MELAQDWLRPAAERQCVRPTRKLIYEEKRIYVHVLLVHACDERFGNRDACELHEAGSGRHNGAQDFRAHRVDHNDHLLHQDFLGSPARAQAGSIRLGGGLTGRFY